MTYPLFAKHVLGIYRLSVLTFNTQVKHFLEMYDMCRLIVALGGIHNRVLHIDSRVTKLSLCVMSLA